MPSAVRTVTSSPVCGDAMTVADVLRACSGHEAEQRSPLMVALLQGAAADWVAGGPVRGVLEPYADEPRESALPLRFAAALHRLVLTGQAPELAAHYPTAGGPLRRRRSGPRRGRSSRTTASSCAP